MRFEKDEFSFDEIGVELNYGRIGWAYYYKLENGYWHNKKVEGCYKYQYMDLASNITHIETYIAYHAVVKVDQDNTFYVVFEVWDLIDTKVSIEGKYKRFFATDDSYYITPTTTSKSPVNNEYVLSQVFALNTEFQVSLGHSFTDECSFTDQIKHLSEDMAFDTDNPQYLKIKKLIDNFEKQCNNLDKF